MHLIDTNVAIYLRDVDPDVVTRVAALPLLPKMSLLSWVELEGGVHRDPDKAKDRRTTLDDLLRTLDVLPLDAPVVRAYARIVATAGFARSRILDRLIAATAMVHDLTLVTINGDDFRDIPGLALEVWPAPSS